MYICPLDDPNYIVQGCYSDGRVCESTGSDLKEGAIQMAKMMLSSLTFEGDYVFVMSRDGELVYDSRAGVDN